jgi:hypothetical protein
MTKPPKYPVPVTALDDAPKAQRAQQELPSAYVRLESSDEAYQRAYPQFYKPLPRRLARRRAIREGY